MTEAIRQELKQRGRLGSSTTLQVHDPLDWTRQQKTEARNYRPGMILTLTKRAGGLEPSRPFEIERVHAGRLYLQGQTVPFDPAKHADRLQVAIPRETELAAGDPILIRRNARRHGLINGEVLTCTAVQSDRSILTREGKTLPASFRDFAHGYVVTSHKSQGRTHDQVVIAAAQMDAKAAYVACSRGRHEVSIFTPDKAQLFERAEQSGDRLAASDVLDPASLRSAVWQQQEERAWQQAVEQAAVLRRISQPPLPSTELEPPAIHLPLQEPETQPQSKEPDIGLPFKEPEIRLPSKQLDWPSLGLGR